MSRTILLYEPHQDRVAHLVFLFNLSDIRCTQARTVEEALNWLTAAQLQIVDFHLVLIGSLLGNGTEPYLLDELNSFPLPVVYLQSQQEPVPARLRHKAVTCTTDNLLSCVNTCLVM